MKSISTSEVPGGGRTQQGAESDLFARERNAGRRAKAVGGTITGLYECQRTVALNSSGSRLRIEQTSTAEQLSLEISRFFTSENVRLDRDKRHSGPSTSAKPGKRPHEISYR